MDILRNCGILIGKTNERVALMDDMRLTPMDAARALADAIQNSEEYRQYIELKDIVMGDATNRAFLMEYQSVQTQLQMAAMAGKETTDSETTRFQQLGSLLYMNPDTAKYLMAQLRLQKLVGEVFTLIAEGSGLDLDFPGM